MYNVLAHIKFTSHDSGPLIAYDHFALYAAREKKNVCGKNAHTDKIWFLSHSSSFYYSTFLTEFGTDIGYDLCCFFPVSQTMQHKNFMGWFGVPFAWGHTSFCCRKIGAIQVNRCFNRCVYWVCGSTNSGLTFTHKHKWMKLLKLLLFSVQLHS